MSDFWVMRAFSPLFFIVFACFLLLLIAKFCFRSVKGGARWLRFGGVTIQPSEFAKIAIILFVAYYCSEHQRTFYRWRDRYGLFPLVLPVAAVAGAILFGRDLGTTILVLTTASLALFVAGMYLKIAHIFDTLVKRLVAVESETVRAVRH